MGTCPSPDAEFTPKQSTTCCGEEESVMKMPVEPGMGMERLRALTLWLTKEETMSRCTRKNYVASNTAPHFRESELGNMNASVPKYGSWMIASSVTSGALSFLINDLSHRATCFLPVRMLS
jgi:hypothetical protein